MEKRTWLLLCCAAFGKRSTGKLEPLKRLTSVTLSLRQRNGDAAGRDKGLL